MHEEYYAALAADAAFSAELQRVYGKSASDMRYRTNEFSDPHLVAAWERKLAADSANLQSMQRLEPDDTITCRCGSAACEYCNGNGL